MTDDSNQLPPMTHREKVVDCSFGPDVLHSYPIIGLQSVDLVECSRKYANDDVAPTIRIVSRQ